MCKYDVATFSESLALYGGVLVIKQPVMRRFGVFFVVSPSKLRLFETLECSCDVTEMQGEMFVSVMGSKTFGIGEHKVK